MPIRLAVAILLCASLFVGCAGQDDPYGTTPNISLSGSSCLEAAPSALEAYVNGTGNAAQISGMWNCLSYALHMFSTYVQGENKSEYTADELRTFIEDYFLQNSNPQPGQTHVITDNFLKELLVIKSLFIGGTSSALTQDEITKAYGLFNSLNTVTLNLLPNAPLLFGQKSQATAPTATTMDGAVIAVNSAAQALVNLIAQNNEVYQFSDLTTFLHELYLYIHNGNAASTFKDYSAYVPLLAQVKGLLMNSTRSEIGANEWIALGPFATQATAIYVRSSFYLSGNSLLSADPLSELRALIFDFTQVLRQGIAQRNGNPLAMTDLDAVIDAAAAINLLPAGISSDTAKNLVERFFDFILNPQNVYPQAGISSDKLTYFENTINNWETVQTGLITNVAPSNNTWWTQMQGVINGPWPLVQDATGRVILDGDLTVKPNLASNSRLNWARVLVYTLYQAYILDPTRRQQLQLSSSELHTAFLDLKPALVYLGIVDPNDATFDASLFREANLFMPRSDGDTYLSFYELIEYIHLVYGGLSAGDMLFSDFSSSCAVTTTSTDVTCWRTDFQKFAKTNLSYMPWQVGYLNTLSQADWNSYIQYMEIVNRPEGYASTPIMNTDIYDNFVLLQYVEVLMLRFDPTHTGTIGTDGSLKMLDLFLDTIAQALGVDPVADHDEVEAFFTFVLNYGTAPDPKDPISWLLYENWKLKKGAWNISLNRSDLLHGMAILTKLGL